MQQDPVTAFNRKLQRHGYITDNRELVTALYSLPRLAKNTHKAITALALDGAPGVGKTFAAETFQKIWGAEEFIEFQFTAGAGYEALLFDMHIANIVAASTGKWGGDFSVRDAILPGVLPRALEASQHRRTVVLLDELDKARAATDAFLLGFLQACKVEHPAIGTYRGNPHNIVVFITKNNERDLSEPLLRRCLTTTMHWPKRDTEVQMIVKLAKKDLVGERYAADLKAMAYHIVEWAGIVRQHAGALRKVPSSPELANALRDCVLVPKKDRGHRVWNWLFKYPTDMDEMAQHWQINPEKIREILARY